MTPYFEKRFSEYQTGSRKGFNLQTGLGVIIEKFRNSLHFRCEYVALLTDLSKALQCLSYYLITAKLHAYGFIMQSLRLMQNYLTNRYQRVKSTINTVSEALSNMENVSMFSFRACYV